MIRLLHITTVPMSLRFLRGQIGYMQAHGIEVDVLSSPGPLLDTEINTMSKITIDKGQK